MFDLSQLTDRLSGLMQGTNVADLVEGNELLSAIANNGLNLEDLQGLGGQELADMLWSHGIDVAAFPTEQLTALGSALSSETAGTLADVAGSLWKLGRG